MTFDPEDTQEFVALTDYRTAPQYIVVHTPIMRWRKKRYSYIQFPTADVPHLDGYTSMVVELEPGEDPTAWLTDWAEI